MYVRNLGLAPEMQRRSTDGFRQGGDVGGRAVVVIDSGRILADQRFLVVSSAEQRDLKNNH